MNKWSFGGIDFLVEEPTCTIVCGKCSREMHDNENLHTHPFEGSCVDLFCDGCYNALYNGFNMRWENYDG